jgi:hypothetical protein
LAPVLLFPTTTSGDVDTNSTNNAARNNATTLSLSYANITECDWLDEECDDAGNVTE